MFSQTFVSNVLIPPLIRINVRLESVLVSSGGRALSLHQLPVLSWRARNFLALSKKSNYMIVMSI